MKKRVLCFGYHLIENTMFYQSTAMSVRVTFHSDSFLLDTFIPRVGQLSVTSPWHI